MKAIIAWLFRCRHTRSNIWIDMVSNLASHTCLDCDAVREEGGDWGVRKPSPPRSEPSSQTLGSRAWIGEYPRYSIVGPDGKHTPISREQYLRAMAGEDIDTTGLCTVREWAEKLTVEWNGLGFYPDGEMAFNHNGRKYLVEMKVIEAKILPTLEDVAMKTGYDSTKVIQ